MSTTFEMLGSDGGHYWVRDDPDDGGNRSMAWLGVAADRAWAHVFWGTVVATDRATDDVRGSWWDIPIGGVGGSGDLSLVLDAQANVTRLTVTDRTGGFGLSSMSDDQPIARPSSIAPTGGEATGPGLTGVFQGSSGGFYYVREMSSGEVVWCALRPDFAATHVFKGARQSDGTVVGVYRDLGGSLGGTDWTGVLTVRPDAANSALTFVSAVREHDGATPRAREFGDATWARVASA